MAERTHVIVNGERVPCGKKVKLYREIGQKKVRELIEQKREERKQES